MIKRGRALLCARVAVLLLSFLLCGEWTQTELAESSQVQYQPHLAETLDLCWAPGLHTPMCRPFQKRRGKSHVWLSVVDLVV